MRSFCAIMGSVTVPVVYAIMRESGYPVGIALFSACLVLFGESTSSPTLPDPDWHRSRQRTYHPNPSYPARRSSRPFHVPRPALLRQISPAAISRVHPRMVVMAPGDWRLTSLHPWLQDGRLVHVPVGRSGGSLGSMGYLRREKES